MDTIVSISLAAFLYFILAFQVTVGMPALYEGKLLKPHHAAKLVLPHSAGLVLSFFAATFLQELFLLFGMVSVAAALKLRRSVQETSHSPKNWMITPLTTNALSKRPILAFDVFTVGLVLALILLV